MPRIDISDTTLHIDTRAECICFQQFLHHDPMTHDYMCSTADMFEYQILDDSEANFLQFPQETLEQTQIACTCSRGLRI
jgi:hypothetical protein